ncbi:MAG: hypothetical protein HYR85_23520 [Planctomycetes bacterium]|nr:hypothetical protein [Planctomycetota bacterium]MBI3847092.1 hypothetical protein [Planctomycetota bacterium]
MLPNQEFEIVSWGRDGVAGGTGDDEDVCVASSEPR